MIRPTLAEILKYAPPMKGAAYPPVGGKWPGIVGSAGYILCNWSDATVGVGPAVPKDDVVSLPPGMTYSTQTASSYQFLAPTVSAPAQATQNDAGTEGSGGCWFDTGTFEVTFAWTAQATFTGDISVYCCDYDGAGRAMTIVDSLTNTTKTFASFKAGAYAQWSVTIPEGGSITFTCAPNGGNNQALTQAWFFDAGGAPPPPPGQVTVSAVDPSGNVKSVAIATGGAAPPSPPTPVTPPVIT